MFDKSVSVKPVLFDNIDEIFDERGSTFLAMRKVQWCQEGKEPDESKAKLELRKWRMTPEGEERADKGFSFLTDDGPHELAKVLVKNGYGHTKDILLSLKDREDFKDSVEHLYDGEDVSSDGEYFDMRSVLLSAGEIDEDDDITVVNF